MVWYKKFLLLLWCGVISISSHAFLLAHNFATIDKNSATEYIPGQLIIKFTSTPAKTLRSSSSLSTFATTQGLRDIETLWTPTLVRATIDDGTSVEEKINDLQSLPNIAYVEPNYLYHTQSFSDTYVDNLRGISHISWYQAFDIFSWNADPTITGTIVAVIDAGVAYDHPDLINQMWDGSICKDENGVNISPCLHGYDFYDNDNNPYPVRSSHGTHVAWTIAAEANNTQGILWLNFHAKIMAIRVGDDALSLDSIIKAIYFAKYNGAKIINASFWGSDYSTWMYDAIRDFGLAWWLFVAAAGNGWSDGVGDNNETTHNYPSDYTLDNIISVAATTQTDTLASFSNYWINSVDLGAPWTSIYSTIINLPQSNIYINTFDVSLGDFVQSGTQSSRWILSGMAMGWFENFTTTYPKNINDAYLQKTFTLSWYSWYDLAIQTYCDTPSWSTTDFIEVQFLSWSTPFVLFQTNKYYGPYINDDIGVHLIDYIGGSEGNFYKETFFFDMNVLREKNFILRVYRYSDDSLDQTTQAGCMINYILFSGYTVGASSYGHMNGTSMATPHVAGLASLAWSYRPELSYLDIKNAIITWGDSISALSGKTVSGKRINAYTTLYGLTSAPAWSLTFLSWNFTNTPTTILRLTTNKTGTYLITWSSLSSSLSGTITLTWKDIPLTLTSGDGNKTIGVTFYDILNKPSSLYTASIILDTLAPLTPEPLSPLSGTTLSWVLSLLRGTSFDTWGINTYMYQISTMHDMSLIIMSWVVSTTGVNLTLITWDTSYYRNIQAIDHVWFSSSWSSGQRFLLLRDTIPDTFVLSEITNASLVTDYTASFVIHGITTGSQISIINGTYQINHTGDFVATTGRVYSWDIVTIKLRSASFYSTSTTATVRIGGVDGNFVVTTQISSGGGWWGWGGGWGGGWASSQNDIVACTLSQVVCSWGVYVRKSWITSTDCEWGLYLSKSCSLTVSWIITSWTNISWTQTILNTTSTLINSLFSLELNTAYLYAYTIGITTMPTIQKANMTGTLIRSHMAKMMVNYAIKVLHLQPDTSRVCEFLDTATLGPEIQAYITLSCQLGLMGVGINYFDPYGEVTRAHFGTTLSRALYGDTYNNKDTAYYLDHLSALKNNGIISNTDPHLQELRGYVMLMMMRADPNAN